jgi:muramoyltetrapeptide carboxypeptidase LdcA involved in peptidoglycan recycling
MKNVKSLNGWDDRLERKQSPYRNFDLIKKTKWVNLNNEDEINIKGRCIGGCLDIVKELIGTKYDKVSSYIDKYKNDGIIWFLESFETITPDHYRVLWQMKNAGYFKHCKGILFGRPLMVREDYNLSYFDATKDALNELNIPVIMNTDIGHIYPQIPIVNGAILDVYSKNGKGSIKNLFIS